VLAGLLLSGLFRDHVMRQFSQTLTAQLDQVTARLEFDAAGQPQIDPQTLSDPRWSRPYSGLYWQVDGAGRRQAGAACCGHVRCGTASCTAPMRWPTARCMCTKGTGPGRARLLLVERTVTRDELPHGPLAPDGRGRPARDRSRGDRFNGVLAASLAILLVLLLCAARWRRWPWVWRRCVRCSRRCRACARGGAAAGGPLSAEVQPLIDDFNGVLDRNAEVVARARTRPATWPMRSRHRWPRCPRPRRGAAGPQARPSWRRWCASRSASRAAMWTGTWRGPGGGRPGPAGARSAAARGQRACCA
jgi:hypothetical protein